MRRAAVFAVLACTVLGASAAWGADGYIVNRLAAREFARLPHGVQHPEGIAANIDNGDLYVATFNPGGTNELLRYRANGKLVARKSFGTDPLLGLAFNPVDGKVYLCNAGDLVGAVSKIERIAPDFDAGTEVEEVATMPHIGAPPDELTVANPDGSEDTIRFGDNASAPNAMTFGSDGSLFVSDSFQGAVFQVENPDLCDGSCTPATYVQDGLLATTGFPPFGANGVAFGADGQTLFVANTGDDRILKVDAGTKEVTVFAESLNGADGIAFDSRGRLWVAANQADEIVVLDGKGKPVETLGDFFGVGRDGAPRGLLFPASIVFSRGDAYVTNLSLALTPVNGDEPEEEVRVFTIARIKAPEPHRKWR